LLEGMLRTDPSERMNMVEVQQQGWLMEMEKLS